jgi:hypothetical protein
MSADDIAGLRRRYLLMTVSTLAIDIAFTLVFIVRRRGWRSSTWC